MEEGRGGDIPPKRSGKHMTLYQHRIIFEFLLNNSVDLKLKKGLIAFTSSKFSVPTRTISRIWSFGKQEVSSGIDFSNKQVGNAGKKRVHVDFSRVKEIPLNRRTNIRSLAKAMQVSKSTVYRRIKEGLIHPHTNATKPYLTEANKQARLKFCLSFLISNNYLNMPMFSSMINHIHIDEKWFMMTRKSQGYYLHPDEIPPLRTCKSSNFIDKIMFLTMVAQPRFDPFRNEMFTGKIGIFPFVTIEPARRSSKNCPAGTLETKVVNPLTQELTRRCLIEKVLPTIREKWPGGNTTGTIFIQQDNAKPHIPSDDLEFVEAATIDGWDIRLCFQPPNSPDLNVLDLGFFRAIQALQHEEAPTTINDLVVDVEKSFEELNQDKLDKVFLTLQLSMIEIMKVGGSNRYKQSHFNENQDPHGIRPLQLTCDQVLVNSVVNMLP